MPTKTTFNNSANAKTMYAELRDEIERLQAENASLVEKVGLYAERNAELSVEDAQLERELAECKEEIKADNESISQMHRIKAALRAERDSLAAQVVQMREALENFGEHHPDCKCRVPINPCDCGFIAVLALDTKPAEQIVAMVKAQALREAAEWFSNRPWHDVDKNLIRMADEMDNK